MNEKLKVLIPYLAFISTALIVLLIDFGWFIPLDESNGALLSYFPQGIYVMPIIWLVIMCFPIAWIIFNEKKFNLPDEPPARNLKSFIITFTGLFILIIIFRTMIIWKFNGPYEKMSMIFFLLFQILLIEQVSLSHYGLSARAPWADWKKDLKYIGFLMLIVIILLTPIIIIAIFVFSSQIEDIVPQMIPPNAIILISFPFQTIAVGISEELMFRGYMQENLKEFDKNSDKKSHFYLLILLNTLVFGCFHIPWYIEPGWIIPPENIGPMLTRIATTGAFGFFMCLIYEYTGSLRITIIIHGLWNTLGAFLGTIFLYLDFAIFDTITLNQIILFGAIAIAPLLIGVIILLKTPKFLAKKMDY